MTVVPWRLSRVRKWSVAARAPELGLDQPGPLPQERQVALVELLDDVVGRAVGVDVRVQAVRAGDVAGDLGVRRALVRVHPPGHPQPHQLVLGVEDHHRGAAVAELDLDAGDRAVEDVPLLLVRPETDLDPLAEVDLPAVQVPSRPRPASDSVTTWAWRVRRPSVPSAISRRTQSRARSGARSPCTRNTGVAIVGVVSVIETLGAGARLDPVEPAAGLAPVRLRGAGHHAGRPGTTGAGRRRPGSCTSSTLTVLAWGLIAVTGTHLLASTASCGDARHGCVARRPPPPAREPRG